LVKHDSDNVRQLPEDRQNQTPVVSNATHDTVLAKQLMADDFFMTTTSGTVTDKAAELGAAAIRTTSLEPERHTATGDTASQADAAR
jgi:UDP-N-acetylglucosamine 2-epimerase